MTRSVEAGKDRSLLSIVKNSLERTFWIYTGKGRKTLKEDCCYQRWSFIRVFAEYLIGVLISALIAFMFYRSLYALALGIVIIPVYVNYSKMNEMRKLHRQLKKEFKVFLQAVAGSLCAGYSIENAWISSINEVSSLYGKSVLTRNLREMTIRLRLNESMEKVLTDFAYYSKDEDVAGFAEIFRYARRSGGNINRIIQTTVARMQERDLVLEEIENTITAKKAEQRIISLLFPGILMFLTLTSPEYLESLYHNNFGICLMTMVLISYTGISVWSSHIMDFEGQI